MHQAPIILQDDKYGTIERVGDVEIYSPPDGSKSCPAGHTNVMQAINRPSWVMWCHTCKSTYQKR